MAPFACGSYAGGDSSTVCAPSRSATAQRKSTNAGSLSPPDARRSLVYCVIAQATLAQNGMRQGGLGIPDLDDED
eukprot:5548016-Alexandrium_andersonii.AAC.1